jgi:hypothetical protein
MGGLMTVKVVEIEGKKMLVNETTSHDSLSSYTTNDLIEELSKRPNVTVYPRWVTSKDIFKERHTLEQNVKLIEVVES